MFEPYRIKVVEPLKKTSKARRRRVLEQAGYNPFLVPADCVAIDLISDSGTGAMSSKQWAAIFEAREDFSGQSAYTDFIKMAQKVTGLPYIQPVHQGRVAEHILFRILLNQGDRVLSNTHFTTTSENIRALGGMPIDIPDPTPPFGGNLAIAGLKNLIRRYKNIKMVILTMTSNRQSGQPVSLDNIKDVRRITHDHGIMLVFDACRFADNAYLCKKYAGSKKSIRVLCRRIFDHCDILYLSSKKDGLVNIGGFIGLRDKRLFERLQAEVIRQESFPSSGGLAARDLAAMTVGLQESLDEDFLNAYHASIDYLAAFLKNNGVRIFEPVGGHGVVVIPKDKFPYSAFSLAAEIFLETGIRAGVFDRAVRLAVPRRVYTKDQLGYVAEAVGGIYAGKSTRLKLTNRPKAFFNFFARFKK